MEAIGIHHTRDMTLKCEACGKEYFPNQSWIHERCVTNAAEESVTNFDRIYKWRELNRARYNEKQRGYMRTYRARKRNAA